VDGAENLQLPTRHGIHCSVLATQTVYCTGRNILNFILNFNFEMLLRGPYCHAETLTKPQPLPCTRRPCPCRSCQAEAACTNAERETPALCVPLPGDSLQFMASSPNPLDATEGFNARIAGGIAKEQCEFWGRGRAPESFKALAQEIQKKGQSRVLDGHCIVARHCTPRRHWSVPAVDGSS